MTDFKEEWTVETAMEILAHPTVDSRVWAEAVEWLLLYGPPEIREMLNQASGHAMRREFPELVPEGYTDEGEPVYALDKLAASLGITEEEVAELIAGKERRHGVAHRVDPGAARKVQ